MNIEAKLIQLSDASRQAYMRGLVSGSGGNVSYCDGKHMYISASGAYLGSLAPELYACFDMEGNLLNDIKPSKESLMHLECYRRRPDIHSIFHLHPVYSIAVTCREDADPACGMQIYTPGYSVRVNTIPILPYYKPGSKELAMAVAEVIETRSSVLLANHGILVAGKTPEAALGVSEEIEENAQLTMLLGGKGRPMTAEQIAEMSKE